MHKYIAKKKRPTGKTDEPSSLVSQINRFAFILVKLYRRRCKILSVTVFKYKLNRDVVSNATVYFSRNLGVFF
jgi:hypothetical protein